MAYAKPNICPGEWDAENPLKFLDTNRSSNLGQTTGSYNNLNQKKIELAKLWNLLSTQTIE